MDVRVRRVRAVQIIDQENQHPLLKGKAAAHPVKRQGLAVRGALGEINENVPIQRFAEGPVKSQLGDGEKKIGLKYNSNVYSHVQSKIDTGLSHKPTARPLLRREESTASHAVRAAAKAKLTSLKKTTTEANEKKEIKKPQKSASVKILEEKSVKLKENKAEVSLDSLKLASDSEDELPPGVVDIDAKDKNSILLLSHYIKDIYNYLGELEDKYPIGEDYLRSQPVITGSMRAILIDWLVEVQQKFTLLLETLHLTVSIVDRYLQVAQNVEKSKLQLIGVTAMFIASKYEEIYPPDIGDFMYITSNAYTKSDLFMCEKDILAKLDFRFSKPTPLQFLRRLSKASRGSAINHHLGKYFVELCLVNYSMVSYKPSELSAAAVCLSIHIMSERPLDDIWNPTMVYYSTYTLPHILPIINKMAKIVLKAEDSNLKAVYNKYMSTSNAKVSDIPQLKGPLIKELATMTTKK